jgi:hypothetical protein
VKSQLSGTRCLPSVAVACGEAHEAVGKVVALNEGAELAAKVGGVAHGTVPVADDGLGNKGSEVVVVLPADTLDGKSDVSSGKSIITDTDLGSNELGLALLLSGDGGKGGGWGLAGERTKVLLSELDELLVGNTTSTNEDHAVSSVVGLDVVGQVVAGDGLNVLLGAEDGAAKGLVLVSGSVKVVEDNFLELLVNLLLLTEDHVPLTLNGSGLELRVLQNIGEDIDGLGDIVVEGLGVVDSVLPLKALLVCNDAKPSFVPSIRAYRCVGVKVSTHVLNFELQLVLRALAGAL